jgi:hypothetical protein
MSEIFPPKNTSRPTNHDTTKALISIFDSSEGITSILASEEAFFNCEITSGKLVLLSNKSTAIGSFGIAAPVLESTFA